MALSTQIWCGRGVIVCATLSAVLAFAQPDGSSIKPLRTAPTERFAVNPGFRDWGPTTITGSTILGGNPTNRGGVFAVDTLSGKLKWAFRPVFASGTASVSTAPAVSDSSGVGSSTALRLPRGAAFVTRRS